MVSSLSIAAGACNQVVLLLYRPQEIIILLMAAFWGVDRVLGSTLLLQHLHQIRHHTELAQAVSAFVCQLVAEAYSCGEQPVVSLQGLLVEVSARLVDLASLPCMCTVQHRTLRFVSCSTHHSTALLYNIALYCSALLHGAGLYCSVLQHT